MGGALAISLDFELYWGVRDQRTLAEYGPHILGARQAIPAMLEAFRRHDIRATWATVGLLMFDSKEELLKSLPDLQPRYDDPRLSPYPYLSSIGPDEAGDPYHYGASLVRRILEHPGQELGTHTFSHYYCLESGQGPDAFAADLQTAVEVTRRKFGVHPRSLALPRNQWNPAYLLPSAAQGIRAVRGNPEGWLYRPRPEARNARAVRGLQLLDTYLPLSALSGASLDGPSRSREAPPFVMPASRFLRPASDRAPWLDDLKVRRIQRGLIEAARRDRVYHLWWHPHNFGANLDANLRGLEAILQHFRRLHKEQGMTSLHMGDLADRWSSGVG